MNNRCWYWLGCKDKDAYGDFHIDQKTVKSHRFSYEIFHGKIPAGLQIDHLCRNPSCVNPAHLEAVTSKENTYRGNSFQGINSRKIECHRGHPFTKENTYIYPRGSRQCKICRRIQDSEYRQRKKLEGMVQ